MTSPLLPCRKADVSGSGRQLHLPAQLMISDTMNIELSIHLGRPGQQIASTGRKRTVALIPQRPSPIGELLRELRIQAQLTQEELAAAAGVSTRAVSDLERGIIRSPRKDTARLLADALNLTGDARSAFEATARGRLPANDLRVAGEQVGTTAVATRTLPRDSASFVGRQPELRRLISALQTMGDSGGVVRIQAIGGMAGVGKTTLAVHAAHQIASQFADGQIFLQLHGFTPGQRPVDPADALASLLLTAGVSAQQIPPGLEPRARLWRDYLAGKRLLLLLDDAAGHEQVRPLLPGTAGSLVLITSRRHLTALEDAQTISLDTLPPAAAAELLIKLAGRADLDPDNVAVNEITRLCGYLPLAIGMLGRQMYHHPAWSADGLAADLASARDDRLPLMQAENLSVAAAFDLSYQDLPVDQQRLFRRLGLHPGTDIDAFAVAALDGTDLATARRNLEALYDQYLLIELARGRYRLHDLIREHTRALAATDPATEREAALSRLLDYYLHTARRADRHLARRTPATTADAIVTPPRYFPELPTREDAVRWMDAERLNLHTLADYAASHQRPGHAAAISSALHGFLRSQGHWDQARSVHRAAADVTRWAGDRLAEANALTDLGTMQQVTGEYPAAVATLERAIELHRGFDDPVGEANALNRLGVVQYLMTEYPAAGSSLSRALELYRGTEDRRGEANALTDIGVVQYITGDYPAAIASRTRALELYRGLDYQLGEASALADIGVVQRVTGDFSEAARNCTQALELYRRFGYRIGEANALNNLGALLRVTEDYPEATASLSRALTLCRDLGYRIGEANVLNHLGAVQRALGDYPAAAASIAQSLDICRNLGNRLGEVGGLNNLGLLQRTTGDYLAAQATLAQALELSRALGHPQGEAEALNATGELRLETGAPAQARTHFGQALAIATQIGTRPETARALAGIGRSYLQEGQNGDSAGTPLGAALEIYRQLGSSAAGQIEKMLRNTSGDDPGHRSRP